MSHRVWLLRHGATEWTAEGRHTGREDVPLCDEGREQARRAGRLLAGTRFEQVLVSPQTRALDTCRLAGFAEKAETREHLVEWDYGEYEGLTDEQTQQRDPGWDLFRDGCPGGESPVQIAARVDRLLGELSGLDGACLLVGHGKLLRALGAQWAQFGVAAASRLPMDPAAICLLEREPTGPLLRLWNFTGQVTS